MTYTVQPKLNLSGDTGTYNGWYDCTTWNCALWINNEPTIYNIAAECETYADFLYEMQVMCGYFETPDGADYGEADYDQMNEVIQDITEQTDIW